MNFDITILGCGAATPTMRYRPTAQLVSIRDHYFLIDCGEGTQMQMRALGLKMQRISHIFISHLHGDHFYGLLGLISTFSLLGRTQPLVVVGPAALEAWLFQSFKISDTYLTFEIHFISTDPDQPGVAWENEFLEVHSVPLKHRIQCNGFLFREKEHERKLIKSFIHEFQIGLEEMIQLKKNQSVKREKGKDLLPDEICYPIQRRRSYFFCSDTLPISHPYPPLQNVDLIYHESTFLNEHQARAKSTFHSTAEQAAGVAKFLNANRLILGHFSARYKEMSVFIQEAHCVFPNVALAEEGKTWSIPLD